MLGDDYCKVVGVKSVVIKIFDGMVTTLDNLRYFLNLKNLISISYMEIALYEFLVALGN